ncbi:hypothetical protein J27TS8_42700 [Robertmurraya siralis]|uniref:KOW domain-containing protein n=1 Tax=Robertmurraya siralis TaxID=77777 RepID=A0A919WM71_9BACI|nr:KOW domain-containing RNA-binding protein [Robertmurraya siralis]PAE18936.1 RNA-binding protein [Bacillus sp. 7504-2]GIN64277.1 hypothetical protein J27TS8_42700 [Robertmurraya siralis]
MDYPSRSKLGQIVLISHGRDAGQYAIIVRLLDERFVFVADGDKKKFDRPKKKNLLHLELIDYVSLEVQRSLLETGRVTNGKLRYALKKFEFNNQ